ncbi:MAG: hypothetical protein ACRDTF_10885 [Pseudonocardiaceae bacterium]
MGPAVMQRDNERSRIVVEGCRADDGDRCKLVVVHEVIGNCWSLFPHGADQFGVRLAQADAVTVAQAILAGAR